MIQGLPEIFELWRTGTLKQEIKRISDENPLYNDSEFAFSKASDSNLLTLPPTSSEAEHKRYERVHQLHNMSLMK
jgi:hypothetical protein